MNKPKIYQYGYDINEVEQQVYTPQLAAAPWGYLCKVVENDQYGLSQVYIKKGSVFLLNPQDFHGREVTVYIESGQVSLKSEELMPQETLLFSADQINGNIDITANEDAFLYLFSGPPSSDDLREGIFKKSTVFNFRDQYWADILWTMVNRAYAGKKIFFKKGNNSSFHFHCQKKETYFVHSGKLLLRFRAGKGEDKYLAVDPGQAADIPPGLIHQAGGLEDTVVIEISTRDYDNDAFLVESEFTKMPQLNNHKIINKKLMQNNNLKLFLETNAPEEVERALQKDILSGIITSPDIMANGYIDIVKEMADLCKKYHQEIPIGLMMTEKDPEHIVQRAKDIINQIGYNNLTIRIPLGWEEARIIKELSENQINVECASGMNEAQAIVAANAGASYFYINSSAIKDMGVDPFKMVQNSSQLLKSTNTEIIVGGIRSKNMKDVVDAFLAGAHIVATPLDVLEKMATHPKTTENIIRFVNAFHQWGKQ
ncbi:MAG: hypothetical protein HYT21_03055 [Candidatus Nealsonbacteria bacterium]|nr:hypothetical protein [Candidatus Nealsonbacteria bacterium]